MTPIVKLIKRTGEKLFGTFAEGPEPPARFRKLAEVFATAHPGATVADWVDFAARHAGSAYQQGYVRGFERSERLGPDWEDPDATAAIIERLEEAPAYDPAAVVPIEGVPKEQAAKAVEAMNALLADQGMRRGPARR